MKGVKNILVLLTAMMMGMTGVAMAQDKSVSMDRALRSYQTSATDRVTWDFNLEPQITLVGDVQMTGLVVDLVTPHYASIMFNPPVGLRSTQSQVPPELLPVVIPHPMNDPAAHEPDFALLRFSFP